MRKIVLNVLWLIPLLLSGHPARPEISDRERLRILVVKSRDIAFYNPVIQGMSEGLKTRGYRIGDRVTLNTIALDGKVNEDSRKLKEQIGTNPALIVTLGTDALVAVADQKPKMPTLFGMVLDPVRLGVVKSIDAPGGNFTGTTMLVSPGKQLDALLQTAPLVRRIGILYTDHDPTSMMYLDEARQDAKNLNLEIITSPIPDDKPQYKEALTKLDGRVDALWLIPDPASTGPQALADTLDYARGHHLPVLGASSGTVRAGALVALSANLPDLGDVMAEIAVLVLEGNTTPTEMRVRGPRKMVLSLNLETARLLNIKIPNSVLHLADEVFDSGGEGK